MATRTKTTKKTKAKRAPARAAKKKNASAGRKLAPSMLALEARIMFDAAAPATAADVAADQVAQEQADAAFSDDGTAEADASTEESQDPLLQALATQESSSNRREIIFLDTKVNDYQTCSLRPLACRWRNMPSAPRLT